MPELDLTKMGAHVVSVFGAFNSSVLIMMPAARAEELFPDGLGAAAPRLVAEGVERDLADLRKRSPGLADSGLAAAALALGLEIEDPFNSATSKSMCVKALQEALRELRALAPPKMERDGVDQLAERREERQSAARSAATADLPGS